MKLQREHTETKAELIEVPAGLLDEKATVPDQKKQAGRGEGSFKLKMTNEERLKQEQQEIEEIKRELKEQGMNEDEIKRYIAQMKGDALSANSDDAETKIDVTKTRLTKDPINHADIDFDLENPVIDKTHIEYDENDLPLSNKTISIKIKRKEKLTEENEAKSFKEGAALKSSRNHKTDD